MYFQNPDVFLRITLLNGINKPLIAGFKLTMFAESFLAAKGVAKVL